MVGYQCNMIVFNATSVTKHHILALQKFVMDITCFVTISLTTWWHDHVVQRNLTFQVEANRFVPRAVVPTRRRPLLMQSANGFGDLKKRWNPVAPKIKISLINILNYTCCYPLYSFSTHSDNVVEKKSTIIVCNQRVSLLCLLTRVLDQSSLENSSFEVEDMQWSTSSAFACGTSAGHRRRRWRFGYWVSTKRRRWWRGCQTLGMPRTLG